MPHKAKVSPEIKYSLVQRYLNGEVSKRDAARLGGVDFATMHDWIRQYETEGEAGFRNPRSDSASGAVQLVNFSLIIFLSS